MKLIKQTKLVFAEGRSDKVYEIDLCEVGPNQFVVNFRYGKRGAALKDGSKTVAPVKRDEADRVFDKLVKDKVDSGYVAEGAAPAPRPVEAARPSAPPPPAPGTIPVGQDPRAQKILDRLAQKDAGGGGRAWFRAGTPRRSTWPIERAIWRAGELKLREAEPLITRWIGTGGNDPKGKLRDYCIAWALGRCGSGDAAMRALTDLYGNPATPDHVKRIAAESLLLIGDRASSDEFKDHQLAHLPGPLVTAARGGNAEAFAKTLDDFALHQHAQVLYQLYLIDSPTVRPALLEALRKAPLRQPLFQQLRFVFKAAELRRDARVFGILGHRFEKTSANYAQSRWRSHRSKEAFGTATRGYLRRRVWRTLRRLGQVGDPDYCKLAVGVLLAFRDSDAVEPKQTADGRGRPVHWDRFAPFLAFNHILYGKSSRYELKRNGKAWRMKAPHKPGGAAPAEREESFPGLWEHNPGALMQLCAESECTPVHEFAGKALLACGAFLDELELDDIILLLSRPYDATARVGFFVAKKRYDAAKPNLALLAALAACAHAPARTQAFAWIDEHRTLALADSALLAALVVGRAPDTRQFARRLLRSAALPPQVGQALVGRLVAALLALGKDDNELALDAVQTMSSALAQHLATVSVTIIRDLLGHELPGVQELGAELLLRHDSRTGLIPADLILSVLHSPHENVRAVGMRLLGELPDSVLATMDQLLLRLTCDANADIRNASRPLVQRIAAGFPAARDSLVAGLVEALLRRRLAEDVPSHVLRVVRDDLEAGHGKVDKDTILRLLASGSPHAQELGGVLLAKNVAPDALELDEIVALASHEILSVRHASWSMYEHGLARVQKNLASAVRILDAKWQDSRQWAMEFFRRPEFRFTADVLVVVIDSVREDVQAYGRELLQKHFDDGDGPDLLRKLSEHPARSVQLFATNYLERFATGKPERLQPLMPYFTSVLSRVNQGRIAKQRVLKFLQGEGSRDAKSAAIVVPLMFRLAATISIEYRAAAIETMVAVHRAQPAIALPLKIKPPPARAAKAARA
ncbi:MAG TPA: hypothetical protein VMJ10_23820 [Kofleriaceae bacterium]|nr:hypothetical protein [Kofleriaceae bacterium]